MTMRTTALLAAAVLGVTTMAQGAVTLVADSLKSYVGAGSSTVTSVAGTLPSAAGGVGSSAWTSYYYTNTTNFTPATQVIKDTATAWTTAPGTWNNTNIPVASQIAPTVATRTASGTTVGAYTAATNDGAYVGYTQYNSTDALTATTSLLWNPSATAGSNGNGTTAWAYIGLTTGNLTGSIDLFTNPTTVPYAMAIRPGTGTGATDYAELLSFNAGGASARGQFTSTVLATLDLTNWKTNSHTISLVYNPTSGVVTGIVDGISMNYTGTAGLTTSGVVFGVRSNNNTLGNVVTFSDLSVSQVPEPTMLGLLGIGTLLALKRRRA